MAIDSEHSPGFSFLSYSTFTLQEFKQYLGSSFEIIKKKPPRNDLRPIVVPTGQTGVYPERGQAPTG